MAVFDRKANVEHFAQSVPFEKVAANDYNLSVSSYVEAKDNNEVVDVAKLNADLKSAVVKIDQLRKDIDAIVAEIEGGHDTERRFHALLKPWHERPEAATLTEEQRRRVGDWLRDALNPRLR